MKANNPKYCRGQIAILTALTLVVLIGVVGLAIDSGRGYGVKSKLNAAVDAASIAAARAVVEGANDSTRIANAQAAGLKFYNGNFPVDYLGATRNVPVITAVHQSSGYWQIAVSGSADMPTTFMRVLGQTNVSVSAAAQAIRRDVDMMLVLDTSGSLASPSGTFTKLQNAATSFISKFSAGPGGDRVGLVSFASGGVLNVPINKDATRGFTMATITQAISNLTNSHVTNPVAPSGSTASAEGMRRALAEIRAVPAANQSSLRVIVFFSDGAPNDVPGTFTRQGSGSQITGDLYSETSSGAAPNNVFDISKRDTQLSGTYNIPSLPQLGLPPTSPVRPYDISNVPLASYNNIRALSGSPYTNSRCNVNKAARNLVENVANTSRGENVVVFTLGLGAALNSQEIGFCSYGNTELGANIMRRLANAYNPAYPTYDPSRPTDPLNTSDTYNANQPSGLYCYAGTADELDRCFSTIASEILRLSM